ncbi:MAG TPA: cell filamentation protein Fic [Actinomycetales bacterium]|nr:cell filamentation protein Fic [Actinomycetales bacterium]
MERTSSGLSAAVTQLVRLPGVEEAVDAARDACTQLRWHQALRRRTAEAAAESTARAARASAAMEGAELPLDVVRDMLRGAVAAPGDAVGRVVSGALRATAESRQLSRVLSTAPWQALARLHTAAAAGLVDDEALGRPRRDDEEPRDLAGPGVPPSGAELHGRLDGLVELLTLPGDVPALVVAALAHAEVMAMRPFVAGNGLVARSLFRALVVERGLDPTGVAVPEHGLQALGLPAYASALTGYAGGSSEGVAGWLVHCGDAVRLGAAEGVRVADAVRAGRLTR